MTACAAPRHGTKTAYMWGRCRCPEAREAYRVYRKRRREGRAQPEMVDSTGTARRVRALVALGYTWTDLSRHLGVDPSTIRWLGARPRPTVRLRTAAAVTALYDELSTTPGGKAYAYTIARKNGWPPPLAWDDDTIDDPQAQRWAGVPEGTAPVVDEVAIRRALNGDRIKLTRLEKHHAIHARGRMSIQQAADVLHLSYSRAKELANMPLPAAEEVAA